MPRARSTGRMLRRRKEKCVCSHKRSLHKESFGKCIICDCNKFEERNS